MDIEQAIRESLKANDLALWSASGAHVFNSETAIADLTHSVKTRIGQLVADGERWQAAEAEGHIVTFSETGYGLMHPPSCRPDLIGCRFNAHLADLDEPAREPGRYQMREVGLAGFDYKPQP